MKTRFFFFLSFFKSFLMLKKLHFYPTTQRVIRCRNSQLKVMYLYGGIQTKDLMHILKQLIKEFLQGIIHQCCLFCSISQPFFSLSVCESFSLLVIQSLRPSVELLYLVHMVRCIFLSVHVTSFGTHSNQKLH